MRGCPSPPETTSILSPIHNASPPQPTTGHEYGHFGLTCCREFAGKQDPLVRHADLDGGWMDGWMDEWMNEDGGAQAVAWRARRDGLWRKRGIRRGGLEGWRDDGMETPNPAHVCPWCNLVPMPPSPSLDPRPRRRQRRLPRLRDGRF